MEIFFRGVVLVFGVCRGCVCLYVRMWSIVLGSWRFVCLLRRILWVMVLGFVGSYVSCFCLESVVRLESVCLWGLSRGIVFLLVRLRCLSSASWKHTSAWRDLTASRSRARAADPVRGAACRCVM